MPAEPAPARRLLAGWGGTAPTASEVVPVARTDDAVRAARRRPARGLLARGLGRSYGDAAQNAGGTVLDMTAGAVAAPTVDDHGLLRAPAGTSLDAVMRAVVPRGWFVPVTPGTRLVTLGGALAADIHGKNHHVDGAFGRHVTEARLVTGAGEVRTIAPDGDDPELFWATVGGLGLTGAVTEMTVRMRRVATSRMLVDTDRFDDLDGLLAAMEASDAGHRYSVAWIDLVAGGRHLGRSVMTAGDHAPVEALDAAAGDPLAFDPAVRLGAPPWLPPGLVNRLTVRAFNELWFRKAPRRRRAEVQTIGAFFHPLDAVRGWNRLYGRRGFVQHQTVIPFGEEATLRRLVERLSQAGAPSFLAVLKRFGAASPGPLSFPMPGWTLALDIPTGQHGLAELLDELDRLVVDVGGRIYLAKDSRLDPALLPRMYPRLDELAAVRERIGATGVWRSDLARRLGLDEPGRAVGCATPMTTTTEARR